ncbi:MAG TPA: ubiquinol-cytochrome c reductase iron-sulfur subunit [Acidobacteriota bacterium]|nr:ubiquinol-cytochrome c reductase iron-sulfur subunit [Acidobacteriota bacterium]
MRLPSSLFSRRKFLNGLIGGWLAALGAAFIGPLLKFIVPPTREPDQVTVPLADYKDLAPHTVKGFAWGNKPGFLRRTEAGDYLALVGVCTHLDCNVSFLPDARRFFCACHEGWYDEDGLNIAGPPPAPLRRLAVAVEGETLVIRRQG